jgi:hypothetical protein
MRLRQEDYGFEASLGDIGKRVSRKKKKWNQPYFWYLWKLESTLVFHADSRGSCRNVSFHVQTFPSMWRSWICVTLSALFALCPREGAWLTCLVTVGKIKPTGRGHSAHHSAVRWQEKRCLVPILRIKKPLAVTLTLSLRPCYLFCCLR